MQFPTNWSTLVLTLDFQSPPDLVPKLPDETLFRVSKLIKALKPKKGLAESISYLIAILILFGPTYIFRLTLKSTFLLYWPLLFIASAPKTRKSPDGSLQWDDTHGRTLKDKVFFAVALAVIAATLWSIYQPGFYASYAPWGASKGLPTPRWLDFLGFNLSALKLWEWSALIACIITATLFVWSNTLYVTHKGGKRGQPGWLKLKAIYALRRANTLISLTTCALAFIGAVWFGHDTCRITETPSPWLTALLGKPQNCVTAVTFAIPG